jgi:hypothetical protein
MLSAVWSNAPARALLEFDRALLYLAVVLVFALPRYSARRLQWTIRAVAGALLLVCCVALTTRLAADVWPTVPVSPGADRLSYPLTYWNALGVMAGLGAILCFHLASSDRDPRWLRVAGGLMSILATRCNGPNRSTFAAILGVTVGWAAHAGVDLGLGGARYDGVGPGARRDRPGEQGTRTGPGQDQRSGYLFSTSARSPTRRSATADSVAAIAGVPWRP